MCSSAQILRVVLVLGCCPQPATAAENGAQRQTFLHRSSAPSAVTVFEPAAAHLAMVKVPRALRLGTEAKATDRASQKGTGSAMVALAPTAPEESLVAAAAPEDSETKAAADAIATSVRAAALLDVNVAGTSIADCGKHGMVFKAGRKGLDCYDSMEWFAAECTNQNAKSAVEIAQLFFEPATQNEGPRRCMTFQQRSRVFGYYKGPRHCMTFQQRSKVLGYYKDVEYWTVLQSALGIRGIPELLQQLKAMMLKFQEDLHKFVAGQQNLMQRMMPAKLSAALQKIAAGKDSQQQLKTMMPKLSAALQNFDDGKDPQADNVAMLIQSAASLLGSFNQKLNTKTDSDPAVEDSFVQEFRNMAVLVQYLDESFNVVQRLQTKMPELSAALQQIADGKDPQQNVAMLIRSATSLLGFIDQKLNTQLGSEPPLAHIFVQEFKNMAALVQALKACNSRKPEVEQLGEEPVDPLVEQKKKKTKPVD